MLCHHQNTVLYIHAPRGHILSFFAPSPLLPSTLMLHFFAYAEIIFAHILHMLVFPACAIEVQHHNESSPAVYFGNLDYEQSLFSCVVSSHNGYTMVLTNQSAAFFLSTNQNRVFHPCDLCDVTLPIYGHKIHVTP